MTTKELEIQGCRKFVCPNLSLIEEKGKELRLKDSTIKRAKDLAIRYFKDTYHKPHYSSAKHLLPAFVYIALILEGEKKLQTDVAEAFGTTHATVRKWYVDIIVTLKIKILDEGGKFKSLSHLDSEKISGSEKSTEFAIPNLEELEDELEEKGNALLLKNKTIKTAKNLAIRYFEVTRDEPHYLNIKRLSPAFIYLASLLENDRRTQMDISTIFGVSESIISKLHRDIINALRMKIIYTENRRVIAVKKI